MAKLHVLFGVFMCIFAKTSAQWAITLDTEEDQNSSLWPTYGVEYYEELVDIPEGCRSFVNPTPNPNRGYWIRCIGNPLAMIGINFFVLETSESPDYLTIWAYFPSGIEPRLRLSASGVETIVDAENYWNPTILSAREYGIGNESTVTIILPDPVIIIDKITITFGDLSYTTEQYSTRDASSTTGTPSTTEKYSTDASSTRHTWSTSTETLSTSTGTEYPTTTEATTTTEPSTPPPEQTTTVMVTTDPPPLPTEAPFCPPTGVHTFPYPGNCTLYIKCFDGFEQVLSCAPLIFDKIDLICKPESEAVCDTEWPVKCPPLGYEAIPHHRSCSKYYECINGNAYESECAANLYFDAVPDILRCNQAEVALCNSECPESGIGFQAIRATGCKWYKICIDGHSANLECGAGEIFSPLESKCVDESAYTCPYAYM